MYENKIQAHLKTKMTGIKKLKMHIWPLIGLWKCKSNWRISCICPLIVPIILISKTHSKRIAHIWIGQFSGTICPVIWPVKLHRKYKMHWKQGIVTWVSEFCTYKMVELSTNTRILSTKLTHSSADSHNMTAICNNHATFLQLKHSSSASRFRLCLCCRNGASLLQITVKWVCRE